MTAVAALKIGMPLEEFLDGLADHPFDMINGERIPWTPNVALPTWIMRFIFNYLWSYGIEQNLGEAFFETMYVLPENYDSKWVTDSLTPDIMFIKTQQLAEYRQNTPDWKVMPYALIPDVAVEVVSPTDRYTDIAAKIARYQTDGVALIWLVDPKSETVTVYTPDCTQIAILTKNDTLTGGAVLPDFVLPIADMFNI